MKGRKRQLQKRGDLSINVIVMAVVALLVLIVLAIILIKNMTKGEGTATACENAKGTCVPESECRQNNGLHYAIADSACNGNWCCVTPDAIKS